MYTPHVDCGDNIIVVNADKGAADRAQAREKDLLPAYRVSRRHQAADRGGGARGRPSRARIMMAVQRMLPKESPLARKQLGHLKVYAGAEHPHEAQNPEVSRRCCNEFQEQ